MIKLITDLLKLLIKDTIKLLLSLLSLTLCTATIWIERAYPIRQDIQVLIHPMLLTSTTILFWLSLYIGSLLILSHHRSRKPAVKKARRKDLPKLALHILTFFGQQDDREFTTEDLVSVSKETFNKTQLAIDQLLHFGLLNIEQRYGEYPIYWLSTEGRKFLDKENLL